MLTGGPSLESNGTWRMPGRTSTPSAVYVNAQARTIWTLYSFSSQLAKCGVQYKTDPTKIRKSGKLHPTAYERFCDSMVPGDRVFLTFEAPLRENSRTASLLRSLRIHPLSSSPSCIVVALMIPRNMRTNGFDRIQKLCLSLVLPPVVLEVIVGLPPREWCVSISGNPFLKWGHFPPLVAQNDGPLARQGSRETI